MKKIIAIGLVSLAISAPAATLPSTPFYCDAAIGHNTNSGSTTNAFATYSTQNGNWDGSAVFTPTDGSTPASFIIVDDPVTVYPDGSPTNWWTAHVKSVVAGPNGAITLSTTAGFGIVPSSSSTGRTLTCGGVWKGPNQANNDTFPMNGFNINNATNASGDPVVVWFRGGSTHYFITNTMQYTNGLDVNIIGFQPYTNTPGDNGLATFDGSGIAASFTMFNYSGKGMNLGQFEWCTNGTTGTADALVFSGTEYYVVSNWIHDIRGNGFTSSGQGTVMGGGGFHCDLGNASGKAAYASTATGMSFEALLVFSNDTANAAGMQLDGGINVDGCIFVTNKIGIRSTADVKQRVKNCDFVLNIGDGTFWQSGGTDPLLLEMVNCNFLGNGGLGAHFGGKYFNGVLHCMFGSGTMTNAGGNISAGVKGLNIITNSYAANVSPYANLTNYDFRIVLAAAKNTGFSPFMGSPTVGYPDFGAAQHLDSGGTAVGTKITFH